MLGDIDTALAGRIEIAILNQVSLMLPRVLSRNCALPVAGLRVVVLLAGTLLLAETGNAQSCTTTFTNTGGGNWNEPTNWSAGVPDGADDACLTTSGTYTVTASTIAVRSIRIGGPAGVQTLQLNGNVTTSDTSRVVDGGFIEWQSGYFVSSALINEGGIRIVGTSGSRGVRGSGAVVVNRGQFDWDDGGLFYIYDGGSFINEDTFGITGNGGLRGSTGSGIFMNEVGGLVEKTGTETATVAGGSLSIINLGRWNVQGGELDIASSSRHEDATIDVGAGGTLDLRATTTFVGQLTGMAAGALLLQTQLVADTEATINFSGNGLEWRTGYLDSGTLSNEGIVRLTGTSGSRGVRGATASLVNTGEFIWDDGGLFYVYDDGAFINEDTFRITGSAALRGSTGSGSFVNESGALVEKTGTETATVAGGGLSLINRGRWSVHGGELDIASFSRHEDVTIDVGTDGTLDLRATTTVAGQVTGAAEGALLLQTQLVADSEATISFSGNGFEWRSGYVDSGTLYNEGIVRLTGTSGSRGVRGAESSLINRGEFVWDDGGLFYVFEGGSFRNEDLIRITGNGGLRGSTGGGEIINEEGAALEKSGSATATVAGGLAITNRGLWDVQGGVLDFSTPSLHENASLNVDGEASLLFRAALTFADTLSGEPQGLIRLDAPLLVADGAVGVMRINEAGVRWRTGYVEQGTVVNEGVIRLIETSGSRGLRGVTSSLINRGNFIWDDGGLFYIYEGAAFTNEATFRITGNGGMRSSTGTGTFVNEVGALLEKSGDQTATIIGALTIANRGRWAVEGGVLSVGNPNRHEDAVLDVADGASLNINSQLTVVGDLRGTATGTFNSAGSLVAAAGARLDFDGTGFGWTGGYLESGTLVNDGLLRLAGNTNSRGVRGNGVELRNDGVIEWVDGGLFYVYNGALFENTNAITANGAGGLRAFTGGGQFVNADTGMFTRDGEGTFSVGLPAMLDGTTALEGTVDAFGYAPEFVGEFGPSLSDTPARLDWLGGLILHPEGDLRVRLSGPTMTDYDRIHVRDSTGLDGRLQVVLDGGYVPAPGATFYILEADSIYGGFRDLTALTLEANNLSLYPSTQDDTLFVLTAVSGIPTVSGTLNASPAQFQAGESIGLTLTGTGFAPDISVQLACNGCFDPVGAPSIPARIVSIAPGEAHIFVDFTGFDAVGTYDVVVTDPRGGEVRTGVIVDEPPLRATVSAAEPIASEEDGTPGLFLVQLNRPPRTDLTLTYTVGGNATRFSDYSLDTIGGGLAVPAGVDSVGVVVFPVSDDVAESDEFVTLSVSGAALEGPSNSASVRIADGPGTGAFAVYASAPRRAGNAGTVTVTIAGQGFTADAMVFLGDGGGGRREALANTPSEDGTRLRSVFQLSGLSTGVRDLVVENGDGSKETLVAALEIEDVIYPDVFVQVNAPPRVPRTRERTYTVTVHNRGNINVLGTPAIYGLPVDVEWLIDPALYGSAEPNNLTWNELQPFSITPAGATTGVIYLPPIVLSAGEVRNIEVKARVVTPQTLSLLGAWIYTR